MGNSKSWYFSDNKRTVDANSLQPEAAPSSRPRLTPYLKWDKAERFGDKKQKREIALVSPVRGQVLQKLYKGAFKEVVMGLKTTWVQGWNYFT